jgi:uncharacterized membrane protein
MIIVRRTLRTARGFLPQTPGGVATPTEHKLTLAQRAADAVTEFCGSWTFIVVFSAFTFGWMLGAKRYDAYPFIFLNLILTVVSTFQSPLIMMSQNRQMERDRDAVQGLHDKLDAMAVTLPCASKPEERPDQSDTQTSGGVAKP